MAKAFFLNATPYVIAVNLNTSLQNQIVTPEISVAGESATLAACSMPIAASPSPGTFGGNERQNLLLVISEGSLAYLVLDIRSSVPVVLDLFFYILGDQVVGMDAATGFTGDIVVKVASKEVAARMLKSVPRPTF